MRVSSRDVLSASTYAKIASRVMVKIASVRLWRMRTKGTKTGILVLTNLHVAVFGPARFPFPLSGFF